MVDDVLYYVLVLLTLLPVYLLFKLLQWMGWELFVNNWCGGHSSFEAITALELIGGNKNTSNSMEFLYTNGNESCRMMEFSVRKIFLFLFLLLFLNQIFIEYISHGIRFYLYV